MTTDDLERRVARLEADMRRMTDPAWATGRGSWGFKGTADRLWTSYSPSAVSITNGTLTGTAADLLYQSDANLVHVDEAAATPGIDLIVDFENVVAFDRVWCNCYYAGSATHAVAIQLYYWLGARWITMDAVQSGAGDTTTAGGYIYEDHSIFLPGNSSIFVGTGANSGKVRLRLYHTMGGSASHDLYVDFVRLDH